MANLTSVVYSAGAIVGTTAGTVSTLDALLGTVAVPSANILTIQGVAGGAAIPVSGTFWQATQPISAASLPLPTGAATAALQPGLGTAGAANANVITVQGIASMTPLLATITGSLTNISGTISLPTGAATAAKQPALGTAGTPSTDVITMQGAASMTPILVNPGTAANWGVVTQASTTSGQSGTLAMGAVTTASPTYVTGNSNALSLDTSGSLRVAIISGAGSGGTALADEAAFTEGTTSFTPIGGVFKTSQTALTTGQAGALALTAAREAMTIGKVWDGTNTAAVKAASTAAVATDQALVVTQSPNNLDFGSGTGGSHTQRIIVDTTQIGTQQTTAQPMATGYTLVAIPSDQVWPKGMSPKGFSAAFTTLTRPANTTAYTAGDSISNNATAASVTALSATVSDTNSDPVTLTELLVNTTDTGLGGKRLKAIVFNSDPTASTGVGAGDNAAYSQKQAGYVGSFSGLLESFSDGAAGRLVPSFPGDGATTPAVNAPAGGFVVTVPSSGGKLLYVQYIAEDGFTPSANSTTIIGTARGFQGRAG